MMFDPHLGHASQLCCAEEVRVVGDKGDGRHLLQVRNEAGLEMTVSADHCADISRLIFKGDNMGFFHQLVMLLCLITTKETTVS